MQPEQLCLVSQWMTKAEGDLLLARRAAEGEPPLFDGAVFHCQQAAEKSLKGFLAAHDRPLMRTHNLPELVLLCMEIEPEFESLRDAAIIPNSYATLFRYPGEEMTPPEEVAFEAIHLAHHVVAFVTGQLPDAHQH